MKENLTKEEAQRLMKLIHGFTPETSFEDMKKQLKLEEEMEAKGLCYKCGSPIHPCLPCEEVVMLNGNHTDSTYNDLLNLIMDEGRTKKNRTGIDTIGVFGAQAKFDVSMDAFPILTTKKVWFKGIVHELLWFIKGDTNIKYLVDNDVHIWDEWAYKKFKDSIEKEYRDNTPDEHLNQMGGLITQAEFIHNIKTSSEFAAKWGDLGDGTYGGMWRAFPYFNPDAINDNRYLHSDKKSMDIAQGTVDQLQKVVDKLKSNPDDRRMIVSAWHPYWVDHCALPPCHCLFHFNTEELTPEEREDIAVRNHNHKPNRWESRREFVMQEFDRLGVPKRRLNCLLYQRSCDTFLGVPFNITSYCLLLAMVAHCSGMEPGVFTHTYGDLHLYVNHLDQVKEQLSRTPKVLPKLWLNPKVENIFDFKFDDIKLVGYDSHPAIKGEVAV